MRLLLSIRSQVDSSLCWGQLGQTETHTDFGRGQSEQQNQMLHWDHAVLT